MTENEEALLRIIRLYHRERHYYIEVAGGLTCIACAALSRFEETEQPEVDPNTITMDDFIEMWNDDEQAQA